MEEKFEQLNTEDILIEKYGSLTEKQEDLIGLLEAGQHISGVFDEFMGPYVLLERNNLEVNVERLISQDLSGMYARVDVCKVNIFYKSVILLA